MIHRNGNLRRVLAARSSVFLEVLGAAAAALNRKRHRRVDAGARRGGAG